MWKSKLAFLLALTSLIANAQIIESKKPVICSDLKTVVENISGIYNESPYWNGLGTGDSKYLLMVNKNTLSWTMIQYNDNVACIVGEGQNSHLIKLGKII